MNADPKDSISGGARPKEHLMILTLKKFSLIATSLLLVSGLATAQDNRVTPPQSLGENGKGGVAQVESALPTLAEAKAAYEQGPPARAAKKKSS